jgi:glucokinase
VKPPPFNALGLDVGGTKVAAGLVTFPEARVRLRRTIPTEPRRGGAAVLAEVLRLAEDLLVEARAAGLSAEAVGLGLCELVSPAGRVLSGQSLDWRDLPVRERFAALAPFTLEADARAAARAEAAFGAGRGLRQFLYVTVGTGIASCLVLDGEPFTGTRGATGTLASAPWNRACEHCGHLSETSLEEFAGGPGLVRRLNQRRPGGARTGQDVLAAAASGDPPALEVVRTGAAALGSAVALLVNVLDPQAVIIGGGLGARDGPYWETLVPAIRRHIWSPVHRELPVLRAATGVDAGVIGAAAAAWARTGRARKFQRV